MNKHTKNNQSGGNKVATYIARAVIGLFGIGLLVIFITFKIWKTENLKVWMTFGALIGLCVGYGLGGDIWGARLFDLFTGHNSRRLVEKDGQSPSFVMPKATLLIILCVLVVLLALLVRFVWCKP